MNARMYRGTWLLVGVPLLVAAFSVGRPDPLPAPALPPTFDGEAARLLAEDFAKDHPRRTPGTADATGAARWVTERFRLLGFRVRSQAFDAEIPGLGRVRLENLVASVHGPAPESPAIVVLAHRDDLGTGPGANDNASGTAALVELARAYALTPGSPGGRVTPAHEIVFVSTDGGAFGAVGADRFAEHPAYRDRIAAVVVLDSLAGRGAPRLEFAGDEPRSPTPELLRTAAARVLEQSGREPDRPSAARQLLDLAFPFSLTEQAPFVGRGIPAVTLTSESEPVPPVTDSADKLDARRLGELGRASQRLLGSLDEGVDLAPGTASYVYLGPRTVRGWAIEIVLIASTLPFLAAAVDLFARCRRRRIPLAPALRSYRSRLGLWLAIGVLFALLGLVGAWPSGVDRPLAPTTAPASEWPAVGLGVLLAGAFGAWLVARERLLPRRRTLPEEELAGYTAALLVLGVLTLVVVALNPFALVFLLPALHAWIWLPQLRDRPAWTRLAVFAAGLAGPGLVVAAFATRAGIGLDAPWYVGALGAVGYIGLAGIVVALAGAAAAAQLAALGAGRYAPYPDAAERPPRGPIRELVRRIALALGARRAASTGAPSALEG